MTQKSKKEVVKGKIEKDVKTWTVEDRLMKMKHCE